MVWVALPVHGGCFHSLPEARPPTQQGLRRVSGVAVYVPCSWSPLLEVTFGKSEGGEATQDWTGKIALELGAVYL